MKGDLSYDEICDLVRKNAWNYIKSAVEIKDGENIKTIRLSSLGSSHISFRNKLYVRKDSVYCVSFSGKIPRKDLKIALKKFYLDRGDRGVVVIELDRSSAVKDLESLLLYLSQEFDKMNSETVQSYDLDIFLDDIKEFKPPPPPE